MPSVRDKAFNLSSGRYKNSFKAPKLAAGTAHLGKWIISCFQHDSHRTNRLGKGQTDMPMAGSQPNEKRTGRSNHSPGHPLADKSTDIVPKRRSRSYHAEDSGGERGVSSTSNKSKPFIPTRHTQGEDKCGSISKVIESPIKETSPAQTSGAGRKSTVSSSEYLEQQVSQHLRRRKKEIVDSFMATILECLDKKLASFEEAVDGDRSSSRSQSSGGLTMSHSLKTSSTRKRQLQRDQEDAEEDGKEDNRRDRNSKRARTVSDDGYVKYACPYYKFNPERFKNCRTCCGPGWKDVHRVKEHLGRCHRLPQYQCNRCCELFEEEDELKKHQRAAKPCPVREKKAHRNLADGFDQEQWQQLQKRSRKPGHEKWIGWYCILFNIEPNSSDIPSPYHGVSDSSDVRTSSSYGSYQQYCDYLRQELPPLIRSQVEEEVDKALIGAEDKIRNNVQAAIKDIPSMLYRIFQSIPPPPEVATTEGGEKQDTTKSSEGIPPDFDPDNIFDEIQWEDFELPNEDSLDKDGFDLHLAAGDESLCADFSASSRASDTTYTVGSSNVSVEETNAQPYLDARDFEAWSRIQGYTMPQLTNYGVRQD